MKKVAIVNTVISLWRLNIEIKNFAQINAGFILIGKIKFSAQDVDFSFEAETKMPYVEKQFPDLEIAFNGKFLCTTLATFKDDVVSMYHDGKRNSTCGIFSDGKDNILVMPLMMNN